MTDYRPHGRASGTIRIWGHGSYGAHTEFVEGLTRAWEDGFRLHQPWVRFENRLHGTASAIGALYTDQGDLAFMGREIWSPEAEAFKEVKGYPPTGIEILTGSFDVRNRGYALVVFVHRDNPIGQLSLAQLDAVFSVERRRGHRQVHTWGDLGLTGEWARRPVRRYGMAIARGFADFFQQAVFDGGLLWCPEMREFADDRGSTGGATDGGQRLLDALAEDPCGIGYSGLLYHHDGVRPLALAVDPSGPAVPPTPATVSDRSYPLTRVITMFLDRPPGQPIQSRVAEFLRFVLSDDGQSLVAEHGAGYLPIPDTVAAEQLAVVDALSRRLGDAAGPATESR